jgi:TM2 domain-containing membrane protein YozV
LDWIRNIGRGVFVDKAKDPTEYVSKKSYIVFALCAVFLGFFAGDKFYMGDYVSGIAKAVLCLNIFTFLIGWVWAAYDAWNAVFSEQDILDHGIPAAPGIGWIFPKVSSEAFKLRPKREGDDAIVASVLGTVGLSEDSGLGPWIRWILCLVGLSSGSKQSCEKPTYRAPSVAPTTAEPVAAAVVNTAKKATNATKVPEPISTAEEPRRQAAPSQRGGSRDEGHDEDVGSITSNEMKIKSMAKIIIKLFKKKQQLVREIILLKSAFSIIDQMFHKEIKDGENKRSGVMYYLLSLFGTKYTNITYKNPDELNNFIKNLMDPFNDSIVSIDNDFDLVYNEYYDLYDIQKDELDDKNNLSKFNLKNMLLNTKSYFVSKK